MIMRAPKSLLLTIIFFILPNALLLTVVNGQRSTCGTRGNYTTGSTYEANLNSLLATLSTSVDENGFYNASMGENNNTVYASVLCKGDIQFDTCRSCVRNGTLELLSICPNQREAGHYNWQCTVRYSDESMFRIIGDGPGLTFIDEAQVTDFNQFNEDLRILIEDLISQAANGTSLRKVAAGSRNTIDQKRIYALVQCTPDLTAEECNFCLTNTSSDTSNQGLYTCCFSKAYARLARPSCNIVADSQSAQPFYNETRLRELAGDLVPAQPGNAGNNTTQIIIIVVSVCAGASLIIFAGFLLKRRMKKRANRDLELAEITNVESLHYEFHKIRAATNGFAEANKLGQGGFGSVYQGKLINGQEIAVKRLSGNSSQGDLEFKNEVILLAKLQHRNLVSLLGFSIERTEKLLIYEFLQNASLDRFIFGPKRVSNLDWGKRYEIIRGIAKGLVYLHEDSRLRIIQRDLKAGNILLDEDMNPKIADFGTARLFVPDETRANTGRIVGTYGYMAPEYALHGRFSVKSDVFSFGVLVLEIISGQKNNSFHENEKDGEGLLIRVAWRIWQEGTAANLIDPALRGSSGIPQDILRCIHIGLLCVQQNAGDRPTMSSVVHMLSSFSSALPVPSEPAYLFANDYTGTFTCAAETATSFRFS